MGDKILVVVDMQNDFINGTLGTGEAEAIVPLAVKKIENFEGHIFCTRDTHHSNYLETQEGKNLPVEHCLDGTDGWEYPDEIKAVLKNKNTVYYNKSTFGSRELAEHLEKIWRRMDIDQIELIGLCTDICVISNALLIKAFIPEVPVTVDASCCAGVSVSSHKNALAAMKMCQIQITNE